MEKTTSSRLLTLKAAAELLDIHPATLRRWADNGDVLVMVTPGGHRRFPVSEIERLAQLRGAGGEADGLAAHLVETTFARAREGISDQPQRDWLTSMNDEQRTRMREMGHRVMSLLADFVARDENDESVVQQASEIGREYAMATRTIGLELAGVLEATSFFRDSVIVAAVTMPEVESMTREQRSRLIRRINSFLNTILISVASEYDD